MAVMCGGVAWRRCFKLFHHSPGQGQHSIQQKERTGERANERKRKCGGDRAAMRGGVGGVGGVALAALLLLSSSPRLRQGQRQHSTKERTGRTSENERKTQARATDDDRTHPGMGPLRPKSRSHRLPLSHAPWRHTCTRRRCRAGCWTRHRRDETTHATRSDLPRKNRRG